MTTDFFPKTSESRTHFLILIQKIYPRREIVIDKLNRAYIAATHVRGIPQFYVDESNLDPYTTQKTDKKKGINRMPTEKPVNFL